MSRSRSPLRAALLAGAAIALAGGGSARAQETAEERIARLEAALGALQAELRELKAATAAAPVAPAASAAPVPEAPRPAPAATVSLSNGRPTFASGDGRFTASLRGVLQLDGAIHDQDDPGPLAADFRRGSFGDTVENDRARDMSDGFNFRRIRLGVEGKAYGDFEYNLTFDFGGSGTEESGKVNAAWVQYNGLGWGKVRVGAFAPVTSFEDAAANTSSLFSERPAAAELVRGLAGGDARTAVSLVTGGEQWTLSGALTGNIAGTQTFDEQTGFVGRATWTPYRRPESLVHLGLNANLILTPAANGPGLPGGAATPVRLRERPELRVDPVRLVDTGSIDADGVSAFGLEVGAQHRSLYLQAEYFDIAVERRAGALPDPDFSGWYVQAGWVLTGEARRYNPSGGFDGPRPAKPFSLRDGQWGAWELGLRYSVLDLNYRENDLPALGSIRGGEQEILSVGLNWYLNSGVTVTGSWRSISVDRTSPGGTAFGGAAPATPALGTQVGQDLDVYTVRTQYAF